MSIQEYIRIIRQRGWIILLAALLAAGGGYGISFLQEELYRATVHVSTVPARADHGLGMTARELLRNFAANIYTPEAAQQAIDIAQLDQNPYDFLGRIFIVPDNSTYTIEIEARDRDGEVAKLMALTMADLFVDERTAYYAQQDKRDRIEVKVRSRAIGYSQIQPKPMLNAIAGGVLGLLFGVGLVFFLTWLESDLLRSPSSLEKTLGLEVVGAIPVEG